MTKRNEVEAVAGEQHSWDRERAAASYLRESINKALALVFFDHEPRHLVHEWDGLWGVIQEFFKDKEYGDQHLIGIAFHPFGDAEVRVLEVDMGIWGACAEDPDTFRSWLKFTGGHPEDDDL